MVPKVFSVLVKSNTVALRKLFWKSENAEMGFGWEHYGVNKIIYEFVTEITSIVIVKSLSARIACGQKSETLDI